MALGSTFDASICSTACEAPSCRMLSGTICMATRNANSEGPVIGGATVSLMVQPVAVNKANTSVDLQFTPQVRMTIRGNKSLVDMPFDARYTGGANRHPSTAMMT